MLIKPNDSLSDVLSNTIHEINRGSLDKRHPFRYVVLSTVNNDIINSRYVVLREVDDGLNLYFHTDNRTAKIDDLKENKSFALVMYHKSKKAQVRINGIATIHNSDQLANKHWENVTGNGKKAYGPLISPGTIINSPSEAHKWPNDIDDSNFAVIKAQPFSIEVLQLNKMEHLRAEFNRDSEVSWKKKWIAP